MDKPVIGFIGRAGAGKDTTADYLVEKFGFVKVGFSWPLKDLIAREFGLDREMMDDLDYKESVIPGIFAPDGTPRIVREAMQIVGTEGFRATDPDYWVNKAVPLVQELLKYEQVTGVAITDVRFMNEALAIRNIFLGGTLWKIEKTGGATTTATTHSSETELDKITPNAVLKAPNGQTELLYTQAASLLLT